MYTLLRYIQYKRKNLSLLYFYMGTININGSAQNCKCCIMVFICFLFLNVKVRSRQITIWPITVKIHIIYYYDMV